MGDTTTVLIAAFGGVAVGGGITWFVLSNVLKTKRDGILAEATKEGETLKEKKILEAKERFLEMKSQHENETREKTLSINNAKQTRC
jgi:ribonuclease Y